MFTKPILLRNKRRLRIVVIVLVIGAALSFAPLLIGLGMMAIEESVTGRNVGEHNSVWGVLPWLTIGTMAIFGGPTLIFLKVVLLGLLHDVVVVALGRSRAIDGGVNGSEYGYGYGSVSGDGFAEDGFAEDGSADDGAGDGSADDSASDASRPWNDHDLKL